MKLIAITLLALGLAVNPALANENNKARKAVKIPKLAAVVVVKAPFENHWDSNSWEAGSQENFWSAPAPTSEPKEEPKQD